MGPCSRYEAGYPCFIEFHKLNVLISSDDGNFRIQFYFRGILQSCCLNFELSMNAIQELSSYRNSAITFWFHRVFVVFSMKVVA